MGLSRLKVLFVFPNIDGTYRESYSFGLAAIVSTTKEDGYNPRVIYVNTRSEYQGPFEPVRKILGILGYRKDALLNYSELHRTPLKITQSIDQFRIIENDLELFSVTFSSGYPGINEPREEAMVREILKTNRRQKEILKRILN